MSKTTKQTTTSKNSNTKKSTSKKKKTNQNKKSVETSKETNSKETTEESKVSNDANDSPSKNKLTKKQKIMRIALGTSFSLLGLSTAIPSIIVCTKLNEKNNQIVFKDSDFVYLRKQIINLVNKEHMNLKSFEKVMLNVFTECLLASNVSISNLIQNVEILNYQSNSITFKITLDSNYKYEFDSFNNEIIISKNVLLISYTGLNSIKFYD